MNPKFYCGIDISKQTLDIALLHNSETIFTSKIENSASAFSQQLLHIHARFNCNAKNTIFCAEHMGIFATNILKVATKKKLNICMESPLRIRLSMGIQRGKNDQLDAAKIAKYASLFSSTLKFWQPPREVILQLKYMSAVRKRLIKLKVALDSPEKLETYYLSKKKLTDNQQLLINSKQAIKADIENVERKMYDLLKADPRLNHLYSILTSIPQVGKTIAMTMIVATNEFIGITSAKKFASYCGIAPFEWQSGTSLKGKARVSHLANKDIKTMLHIAVLGVTRSAKSHLGKYYTRKVAEGKNKMSVLNAVRNKLVHVMYACVLKDELYKQ